MSKTMFYHLVIKHDTLKLNVLIYKIYILIQICTFGIGTSLDIVILPSLLQHLQTRLVKVDFTEAVLQELERLTVTPEASVVAVQQCGQGTGGLTAHVR